VKWDLDSQKPMAKCPPRIVLELLKELESEGLL